MRGQGFEPGRSAPAGLELAPFGHSGNPAEV